MVDNPITRKEKYLAKLTGSYTGNVPDPITRVEKYLYDLCQKGISGLTPEEIENAVNKYLEGKDYVTKTDADKAYQPAGSYLSGTDEELAVSGKAADAKVVGNAVAKIEGINYTDRGTLADTDAFLINDGTGMKKSVLSKLSDFVLNKIADKVFAKLQTNDKTILGAINELNSNSVFEKHIALGNSKKAIKITPSISYQIFFVYGYRSNPWMGVIVSEGKIIDFKFEKVGSEPVSIEKSGEDSLILKYSTVWGQVVISSKYAFSCEPLQLV